MQSGSKFTDRIIKYLTKSTERKTTRASKSKCHVIHRARWLLMYWLQLQSTPCEALPSVWISFAWQYSQACGHPCCLCTFSYPNSSFQSTLHLICFDTALCEQPPLSVMTLCDLPSLWRVSMIVFWIIAKSAVFPIIVVSKNKRYPEFILYGWSFIETQM